MAKKSFLKPTKIAMKSAGDVVVKAGIRGASTVGSAYLANRVIPSGSQFRKYYGLAAFGLGLVGEMFLEDDKLQAIAQGLQCHGALDTTGNLLLPGSKAEFGLAGDGNYAGVGAPQERYDASIDWEKLAEETAREAEKVLNGVTVETDGEGISVVEYAEMLS